MTDETGIPAAAQRLSRALKALESAVERRLDADRETAALAEQIHAMDADRSRLASDLDIQTARARRLETASTEVGRRIDAAMQTVRAVLEDNGSAVEPPGPADEPRTR